ncbi:MAG: GHMP kinase [Candidatus Altiarchaeota archaeon]
MIISRTPLRVSFAGGGSDLKAYYKHKPGAVTSTSINKYVYITVNKRFDNQIRVGYSRTEIVESVKDIQHDLVREALKIVQVDGGIEITSIADIPSRGTGLGSSSSFTVGLLNALHAYNGEFSPAKALAEEACEIEINKVGEPIGKQDQYIAAYGGISHIQFNPDESVYIDPVICPNGFKEELQQNLMLYYTGVTRRSNSILTEQRQKTNANLHVLDEMAELSRKLRDSLSAGDLTEFGELLHNGWMLKKKLASNISNQDIDRIYTKARKAGAVGGKILGAGGGGFLLVYCEQKKQARVREALNDLRYTPFAFEPQGSKIIYVGD